jgi:hypothetical protein
MELHRRWEASRNVIVIRRKEDIRACKRVKASYRHLPVPDCIYRRENDAYWADNGTQSPIRRPTGTFLYPTQESIFGDIHPADHGMVERLAEELRSTLPADASLICPLAIGNHVDHRITRMVAESLAHARLYYADFPYVLEYPELVERHASQGWQDSLQMVSPDGFRAWFESIAEYQSQISTFWSDLEALRNVLGDYLRENGGIRLWKPNDDLCDK